MRKIRLFIASSLDGYIARKSGAVDWLFTDQDYGYTEFFSTIDTLLMGRKTYEQVLEFGEYPYRGKKSLVFSRTQSRKTDENVEFVGGDIKSLIDILRQEKGRDIWLVGGAELIYSFINYGLIDELILSIHPIILGNGIPLITQDSSLETVLKLKTVKCYDSGLVQITYSWKK